METGTYSDNVSVSHSYIDMYIYIHEVLSVDICSKSHYIDVVWARWQLKSSASPLLTQPFIQAQITSDQWIPSQMAIKPENASIWWRHHELLKNRLRTSLTASAILAATDAPSWKYMRK